MEIRALGTKQVKVPTSKFKSKPHEKAYRVALWSVSGVGAVTFNRLLAYFESVEAIWKAERALLAQALGEVQLVDVLMEEREKVDPLMYYRDLEMHEFRVLCMGLDKEYPTLLSQIKNPPPILFLRGTFKPEDERAVAVVGTRKPSAYGVSVTRMLVEGLVSAGVTVVSGLARGIDSVGHRAAIEYGGRTIAVLGGGIDQIYPAEHTGLAEKIRQQGVVVSANPPGSASLRGQFAARNRYVAGLTLGVVVVEGASKSGTRITANYAVKQDKPLFAVPGDITKPMSAAPTALLKNGATLVSSAEDVLEVLGLDATSHVVSRNSMDTSTLSHEQQQILQCIQSGVMTIDEIARNLQKSTQDVGVELTMLEMEGVVRKEGEEWRIVGVKY